MGGCSHAISHLVFNVLKFSSKKKTKTCAVEIILGAVIVNEIGKELHQRDPHQYSCDV